MNAAARWCRSRRGSSAGARQSRWQVHLIYGVVILISLFLSFSRAAHGQRVSGDIEGSLVDSLGAAIRDAHIVVRGPNVQGERGTVSDGDGSFHVLSLPPGLVSVFISHVNHQPVILEGVLIELGRTTSLREVRLRGRVDDLPEVVVTGVQPLIDPVSTAAGAVLQAADFALLPVDRNYRSIATLVPQANASYLGDDLSIGGATGFENKFFIDGMDVSDPSFARTGTNLPYNFIGSVEVITGGYLPEYRSTLGGLVNVTTRSGGNELHGSVFGFYTGNALSASRRGTLLDPAQGDFANYDLGVALGGPVVRDRLWYYAAYNPTFRTRDVALPGLGTEVDHEVTHAFAAKLTWRASSRLNLTLTSVGDPSLRRSVGQTLPLVSRPTRLENPDPYLTDHREGGASVSASGTLTFPGGLLLDASVAHLMRNQDWESATTLGRRDTAFVDVENGTWSGGGFGPLSFYRQRTTARSSATLVAGRHQPKIGAEYSVVAQDNDLDTPVWYERLNDSLVMLHGNGTQGRFLNQILSAYGQDAWQIGSLVRIQAGVRWDRQWIKASDGTTVHVVPGPVQPRLGLILTPGPPGAQKLFASVGRFSQEWSSAVMTIYARDSYFYDVAFPADPRPGGVPGDTVLYIPGVIPEKSTLRGQHYDELSAGYERLIAPNTKAGIRGVYRTFREAIIVGFGNAGNPGRGELSWLPRPERDYAALVLSVERRGGTRYNYLVSYVLSRNHGNYDGLYDAYNHNIVPNVNFGYGQGDVLENATGLLPNDRTHVFKFAGHYRFAFGLTAGTVLTWQSGTPLSEVAGSGLYLVPRGSVGRTPGIWDLNARLAYPVAPTPSWQATFILDAFHIASRRRPVDVAQRRYGVVNADGTLEGLDPSYGLPIAFQPPMSFRLAVEVEF